MMYSDYIDFCICVYNIYMYIYMGMILIAIGRQYTPCKFNIAGENLPSQKEASIPTIIFQGAMSKMHKFRICMFFLHFCF